MIEQISIIKKLVKHPSEAFDKINKKAKKFLLAGIIIAVVIPIIISLCYPVKITPVWTIILSVITGWILLAVLMFYVGKMFNGKAKFTGMLSSLSYAAFPEIFKSIIGIFIVILMPDALLNMGSIKETALLAQVFKPATIILMVVSAVFSIWALVLYIIACRQCHKFESWKAIVTFVIAFIILVVIMSVLIGPLMVSSIS